MPHLASILRIPSFALALTALATVSHLGRASAADVQFNRDIRPILSDRCFQCHGPDAAAREGDLRLDFRDGALAALAPGSPDESKVIARLVHEDPAERMPPRKIHKPVTADEIELIRQWIADGADYEPHWSFLPVTRPELPKISRPEFAHNEIDQFVLARLEKENLALSPPADPRTFLRRLTLDLTGLPPTPGEVEAFLKTWEKSDPDTAVEAALDRLFQSTRYGEHLAYWWLDIARYADSDGYESDPLRTMWPWRDWVIESFANNMPYDQFIVEQLAGDLLETPGLRHRLASGFNRNHRLNNEGGITPEEWIVEYRCDRAETAATAFLGLTFGCARCHDHKFDPITQRDYYQLYAFFDDIEEKGSASGRNAPPSIAVPALEHFEAYEKLLVEFEPLEAQRRSIEKAADYKKAYADWLKKIESNEDARKALPGALGTTDYRKWNATHKTQAGTHHLYLNAPADFAKRHREISRQINELRRTGATVMVMQELAEPTTAHILERGAWDQPRDAVTAGTPAFLPAMEAGLPNNRLGLAHWMTASNNPLTARVAVNRIWERFFGVGLVKTQEDFGLQGETPSHPELLDWLAAEFVASGWDLQALQRKIVLSATYRQSSTQNPKLRTLDPENRLLARGPRYRLPAAVIRDQALFAAGLLVEKSGGPSVKPYQPEGLWREIIKGRVTYAPDTGDKLYRRSLYTLWRRAVNPPLMSLLDANMRDVCDVSQRRTNTPLQALLLMNDVTFVEAARNLGARLIREGGNRDAERIAHALQLVTGRPPNPEEQKILAGELTAQRSHFAKHPKAAEQLIGLGESKADASLDPVELAAHTALARVLLNLDETLTKE